MELTQTDMRDFAKLAPQFWIGCTGRKLHAGGPEATVVAAYLISSPHSNALGLYYLPKMYLAHETGLGVEGAREGLRRAIEAGFCCYDDPTEMVFVPEMARIQIAEQLEPKDNRVRWVQREYDALPDNPFLASFFEKYAPAFHLNKMRGKLIQTASPSEGASEFLRSQETETEHDTEQENKIKTVAPESGARLTLCEPEETRSATPTEAQVDKLYKLFPLKRAPFDAKRAIRKAVGRVMRGDHDHPAMPLKEALDHLAQKVTRYAQCVQGGDRTFIPHPATWFNRGDFWSDEQDWKIEGTGSKKTNGGFHHDGDDSRYEKGADLVYRNE
jgi:hypothetical protein